MDQAINTTLIGSGNMAHHLGPALENIGVKVSAVYGRNPSSVKSVIGRLYEAEVADSLDFSESKSNFFIIAVSDKSIESIASEIILPDEAVVVHTSGSQPLSILGYVPTENIGVFYPLQSFSRDSSIDFKNVPVCLESQNKYTYEFLLNIASRLSNTVTKVESADRKAIHIAAVFANNFTNHLLKISKDILENKGLDFEILYPLISSTLEKALRYGPESSQTGPGIRNDLEIIENHLTYLSQNERIEQIYHHITKSIMETYSPEN